MALNTIRIRDIDPVGTVMLSLGSIVSTMSSVCPSMTFLSLLRLPQYLPTSPIGDFIR